MIEQNNFIKLCVVQIQSSFHEFKRIVIISPSHLQKNLIYFSFVSISLHEIAILSLYGRFLCVLRIIAWEWRYLVNKMNLRTSLLMKVVSNRQLQHGLSPLFNNMFSFGVSFSNHPVYLIVPIMDCYTGCFSYCFIHGIWKIFSGLNLR